MIGMLKIKYENLSIWYKLLVNVLFVAAILLIIFFKKLINIVVWQ